MPEDKHNNPEQPVPSVRPELADVVRAGVKAAREVPGAVAVGGTVCSLYAAHRVSVRLLGG
ncbi:MAG TPA: hypothetical protein VFC78_11705 [Tepidisphaeraceae bacterium]|nr:hypothetical protein [Tepidisphaeraceae bacterium]